MSADPAAPEPDFDATWRALALPIAPDLALALDATITPRTLAALRGADATGAAAVAGPAPTTAALPLISVREGGGRASTADAAPGPDLTVTALLGEGGMGRVEAAHQRSLDRQVALERPRHDGHPADATALRHEALVTGALEHPNIVPIHALGRDDAGRPLLVMKRVEGVVWRALLLDPAHPGWASREPDPGARLAWHLETLAQVCNAVAFAHSRGVIHRDIKPDNVMSGEFGEVYLLDWGLAARPDATVGELVGTPAYMAPEMVRGERCDARTDVYLLGAALHEVLSGCSPARCRSTRSSPRRRAGA